MATNFIQKGETVTVTAPGATSSGAGVQVGQLFGVAQIDAASGADVEILTVGVHTLPKVSAQAWTQGALVYWTGTQCTTASSGNLPIGVALLAAANPSATGTVRLNGTAVADA